MKTTSRQVTALLAKWSAGDDQVLDELTPLVYADLRRLAGWHMKRERREHTLQPSALVNEAFLKLAADKKPLWQDRAHFFAVASRAMRNILVDYARSRLRKKRGAGVELVPLNEALIFSKEAPVDLLALNDAIDRLAQFDLRKARVVELRFFGGLSTEEVAQVLDISPNTVTRDWNMARAWLRKAIREDLDGPGEVEAR